VKRESLVAQEEGDNC